MKICIHSHVNQPFRQVFTSFDQQLFEYLAPPIPKIQILEFGQIEVGEPMKFKLGFPVFTTWIGKITKKEVSEHQVIFEDQGLQLPFGLVSWRHLHTIKSTSNNSCCITDEIHFESWNKFSTYLMSPIIKKAFSSRPKKYKDYFL